MAIYARFGDEITLVREATVAEVVKDWHGEDKKTAKRRVGYGMMWWAKFPDGEERLCELAYCKADDGFKEIDNTRRKLMGDERWSECTGIPITK